MSTIAVVGVCGAERRSYARALAAAGGHRFDRVRMIPSLASRSPDALVWPADASVVADIATDSDLVHTLAALPGPDLTVVCVVDARHTIADLRGTAALTEGAPVGDARGDVGARARQAASALELATHVVFVNWEGVETPALSLQMALASHLNPGAIVRLSRGAELDAPAVRASADGEPLLQRAGWVRRLGDAHDPYLTDPRVTTLRYEQLRPFHPGRLVRVLDRIDRGACGILLRSAGFCRLATRPGILARWEQAGSAMWIDPVASGPDLEATVQDIALTGIRLHPGLLRTALDSAALTDAELAAGPSAWERFADPLPVWSSLRAPRSAEE